MKSNDTKESLAAEYVTKIGYDPFTDDPSATLSTVAQLLREYDAEVAREAGHQ